MIFPEQKVKYNSEKYYICAHAGYLINMANHASPSRDALLLEAKRCDQLGIPDMVVHTGSGKVEDIITTLNSYGDEWPISVRLLLENTAGQGNYRGGDILELQYIIDHVVHPMPLGICYDTAHAWGNGNAILAEIHHPMVKLVHLNDSEVQFCSHKDRHANIGYGTIHPGVFKYIAEHVEVPCIMETPETYAVEDLKLFKNLCESTQEPYFRVDPTT
jgi:deoxyribonuclease-4